MNTEQRVKRIVELKEIENKAKQESDFLEKEN